MDANWLYGQNGAAAYDAIAPASGNPNAGIVGAYRFYTTTAVALAAAGTSSVPVLYNPPSSSYNCRIMTVRYGSVAGTVVQGVICNGIQIGAVLTSLTAGPAALSAWVGGTGMACPFLWYTTATSGVAPSIVLPTGINTGGAYAAGPTFTMRDDVNGFIVLAPGTAFYPAISINAVAMTVQVSVDVIATPVGK